MNEVSLAGKVSRVGRVRYTPAGSPVVEMTIASPQTYFGEDSMGHFEVLVVGTLTENATKLRVGSPVEIKGNLWSRSFRDRRGNKVVETKVIASTVLGGKREGRG